MDTNQIEQIVQVYNDIRKALSLADTGKHLTEQIWHIKEDYLNPFSSSDLETAIRKLRDRLVEAYLDFSMKELSNNITINVKDFILEMNTNIGPIEFDPSYIERKLEPYRQNKDELAWNEMLDAARMLIPYQYTNPGRSYSIESQGNTLHLNMHVNIDKYSLYISYEYFPALSALEKIIAVLLNGAKPSKAQSYQLAAQYVHHSSINKEAIFAVRSLNAPFKSIKLFKNGRLDLTFLEQKDCQYVTHALKEAYKL